MSSWIPLEKLISLESFMAMVHEEGYQMSTTLKSGGFDEILILRGQPRITSDGKFVECEVGHKPNDVYVVDGSVHVERWGNVDAASLFLWREDVDRLRKSDPIRFCPIVSGWDDPDSLEKDSKTCKTEQASKTRMINVTEAWSGYLESAVKLACYCKDNPKLYTKDELEKKVKELGLSINKTALEVFRKALPDELKKGPGAPTQDPQ